MPDIIASKYKIVREIARSNDVVYEAVDTSKGRRLAVKELLIPPNLTGQARRERVERFNREARATGRLAHPNIVTVYDYGEDAGRYFIAMEYLEGGTLRDALQSRGALPLREALDIACQVLSGLAHAHSHHVIHRDVKPDNIHILPGGLAKLTDFGIARLTEEASLTGEGQVFGTPSYMSPEQIEGKEIDHRSDLFSLGVVLYEMLAGRKPFTGDSVVTITYSIMHSDPPPLAGVPYAVEQVIRRALAKVPYDRMASAEEMRQALRAAEAAPATYGPPPQPTGLGVPAYGAYGVPPAAFGPPPVPYGAPVPAGPTGMGPTAYAPPPAAAPPLATAGGPFVNWGATAQPPAAYIPPPPPFARRPAGPLLSEAAWTMLKALLAAVVAGAAILGLVLLFVEAYEQQRLRAATQTIETLNARGGDLYRTRRYLEAAAIFDEARRQGRGTPAGAAARRGEAFAYYQMGVNAFQLRDFRSAEGYFGQVVDLYPPGDTALGDDDRRLLDDTNDYLGRIDDQTGAGYRPVGPSARTQGAAQEPDPNTALRAADARAQADLQAGIRAWSDGRQDEARQHWEAAASEAPGTDAALRAQELLNANTPAPNF